MNKGLDLCYHQGDINWNKVKADGIDFIIPRDGWGIDCDGKQTDPKFLQNVKEAQAVGIQVPGVYHFIYATNEAEARQNAANAINNVRKAGLPPSTVIWCDQEEDTVVKAKSQGYNITTAMQTAITKAFCNYCLEQGYCTGIYLNKDYIVRVYGKDILNQYDIWLADLSGEPDYPCVYQQYDWYGKINGINVNVDIDRYYGNYTVGTAKPKILEGKTTIQMKDKVNKYIAALKELGDGRYHYWDGRTNGIGCSEYTRLALVKAGIISSNETFHAASGIPGPLADSKRFQKLTWNPTILQAGDILWSNGHHVATWDGINGVYEAAPEISHGICDNGKTGVGHWSSHTYRNCGTGTNTWSCIYRIIDNNTSTVITKEKVATSNTLQAFINALPVIKSGSKGDIVRALQAELKVLGYYTDNIDGSAGPNTVKAIKAIQTDWNKIDATIEVDGYFGPKCWNKMLRK